MSVSAASTRNVATWCATQRTRQRTPHGTALGLLIICLSLGLSGCQNQETRQQQAFADSFRAANQASGLEPMLALYELSGSTKQTVSLLKSALINELGLPIARIEFEPLSGRPEENIHYTHNGIEYGPTLEPQLRMRVSYATEDGFESLYSIGKNATGQWRIVSSRPL